MSTNTHFKKSIHSALQLRADDGYVDLYLDIVKNIDPNSNFKFAPTGTWSVEKLQNYYKPNSGDPYYNYKLCTPCEIRFRNSNPRNFLMLGFENKFQMKAFLKDFHINKNQVALCFWNSTSFYDKEHNKIDKKGEYKVVLRISPIKPHIIKTIDKYLYFFTKMHGNTYGKINVYTYVQLASSIHDRWIDPFTFEKIYNFKSIYEHFMRANSVENTKNLLSIKKILHQIQEKKQLYWLHNSRSTSAFVSNKSFLDAPKQLSLSKFSTKFYYTYLEKLNPYKTAKFRKDWKLAAESFISEIFCKQLFKKTKKPSLNDQETYDHLKDEIENVFPYKNEEDFKTKLPLKIKQFEKEIEAYEFDLKIAEEDLEIADKRLDDFVQNYYLSTAPKPIVYSHTDEEFLNIWNNFPDFSKKFLGPTFEEYLSKTKEEEKFKQECSYLDGYEKDPEYQRLFQKYQDIRKSKEDLKDRIKSKKNSIESYSSSGYRYNCLKMNKEFEDLHYSLFGLTFSKKEITLFINSLKLDTKINACKFRKIILDVLLDLKMLSTNYKYNYIKCICRNYLFSKERWIKIFNKLKSVIQKSSSIFINNVNNYYAGKSKIAISGINIYNNGKRSQFAPCVEFSDPPG